MAYTYMLRCSDGSLYCGSTRNLDTRMDQHASGKGCVYTSKRLPVELVWFEEHDDAGQAWARERQIHGWGRAKREALIAQAFEELHALSTATTRKVTAPKPDRPRR